MSRMVSFVVLVAIILLIGALFFRVIAEFLVPMFLAVLLVVMFSPLHEWFLSKCQGRTKLAAALTTFSILLIVLVPLGWILISASTEAVVLARSIDQGSLQGKLTNFSQVLRQKFGHWGLEGLPTDEELVAVVIAKIEEFAFPVASQGIQAALQLLVGVAIMIVSLFYFLLDGPNMIRTLMNLSPLQDKYERQLLTQFGSVSRAVVIATLLSAFVQGILAGIAYWVLGFELVFLLTAITMLIAMVPFVGAAAVWVPCCFWLAIHDGRIGAAVGLALFGVLVISMADNVIKPWVLAGKSNLHPLLALLSVLGGVQALGPIGILVGPMLVSFLQVLLMMLRTELEEMSKPKMTA